jgi:hypothetical protein
VQGGAKKSCFFNKMALAFLLIMIPPFEIIKMDDEWNELDGYDQDETSPIGMDEIVTRYRQARQPWPG